MVVAWGSPGYMVKRRTHAGIDVAAHRIPDARDTRTPATAAPRLSARFVHRQSSEDENENNCSRHAPNVVSMSTPRTVAAVPAHARELAVSAALIPSSYPRPIALIESVRK